MGQVVDMVLKKMREQHSQAIDKYWLARSAYEAQLCAKQVSFQCSCCLHSLEFTHIMPTTGERDSCVNLQYQAETLHLKVEDNTWGLQTPRPPAFRLVRSKSELHAMLLQCMEVSLVFSCMAHLAGRVTWQSSNINTSKLRVSVRTFPLGNSGGTIACNTCLC